MNELLDKVTSAADYLTAIKGLTLLLVLASARFYALAQVFSPTNDQAIQGTIRNGLCLTVGLYISWGQPLNALQDLTLLRLTALLLKEALVGVILGFLASSVFWIAEGVGAMIDNQAGFNNAQQTNPLSGEQSTPLSNLVNHLAHASFWILGGMTALIGALFESYHVWPMAQLTPQWPTALVEFAGQQLAQYMKLVMTLAAPGILVLMLIDLGFGIIGRTADKLEPNNLSQPVKGAVALLMLSVLVAVFFEQSRGSIALSHLGQELDAWVHAAPKVSLPR
jgi:type III secretion protein T